MIVKTLKYLIIIALVAFKAIDCIAYDGGLKFMNLSSKDGLSSNTVNDILKDRFGFMWFASDDGLNKFDGKTFTTYRHNDTNPSSIISNEILDLYEDEKGDLWISTGNGLCFYNRKTDSFIDYSTKRNGSILSVCKDDFGNIWVAGYDGLLILDVKTKKFLPLVLDPVYKSVTYRPVYSLFKDRKGRMWLGANDGLYLYLPKQKSFTHFTHDNNNANSIVDDAVKSITEDAKGNLWIGTANGLSMMQTDCKGFKNYKHSPYDLTSLSSNIIYAIASDSDGKMWIGTEEGLNILDPENGKTMRVNRSARDIYSLVGKSVRNIFIDKQGIYWVATFRGGINKYDKNLPFFNLWRSNPYDLSAPVVTSFVPAGKNKIYVGSDGGGLSLFDIDKGTFSHISMADIKGGDKLSILAMEKVNDEIWMGTFLMGVIVIDTKSGLTKQLKKRDGTNYLSGNDVFCIKKDSRGNVWLGTNGQGVDRYDVLKKTFTHFNANASGKNKLELNGYIRSIEEDSQGNIWIGSSGSGLAVYDPVSGYSRVFNKNNSTLPNDIVTTIHISKNGVVCIGTAGGGLTFYDQKKARFYTYSEQAGLANGVIYKILESDNGKIWVSTNKSISCFDIQTKTFKNYFSHNGVQRSPFVLGAGLKLADGTLFFGGADGINYVNPVQLHANMNVPKVVLTDLKVANQNVVPSNNSQIEEDISVAKRVNLTYKQNFSLSFAALNYTSPEENRYFYKLEGFDKDWNSVGAINSAAYTNLDPGKYIFKVRAASDAGEWSTPIKSIEIFVKPPFWLTYYAYVTYLLITASLLWYMRYRGVKKLRSKFAIEQEKEQIRREMEQERVEAERLREFDQLKIKFLTNISHEFRTPISLITGPVGQLLQQETSMPKVNQLKMISRNAKRLLNLVNQLLDFKNIKQQELKLNAKEGDFIAFSREVCESFRDLAERKQINFEFRSTVKFYFSSFDHDKIERIIFNILSNAFKFTLKGGEVLLKIDEMHDKDGLKVTVSDTGIGIERGARDKIFDRFHQHHVDSGILNQGSGIGLSIVKEFVHLHNASIEVESIVGEGSIFTIYFPFIKIEDDLIPEDDLIDVVAANYSDAEIDHYTPDPSLPAILLVEDNDDFRAYLKEYLKYSYKVIEAINGKDGWQKVLSAHPELVISDISMPEISGVELCRKIKSDKRTTHIPVLLLTALAGEEDELMGLEKGANDYLTKPFNLDILNFKIRNLLELNKSLKNTYLKRIKLISPEVEIESENEKLLNKVLRYIEENLTNPKLSVEDLSRHVGMSRGSLYTKVLELTGESPVEFIRSVKLDKAAVLLEKSDMNVSQISYSVGFATPNYFARAFKEKFDMLPSSYIARKRSERDIDKLT